MNRLKLLQEFSTQVQNQHQALPALFWLNALTKRDDPVRKAITKHALAQLPEHPLTEAAVSGATLAELSSELHRQYLERDYLINSEETKGHSLDVAALSSKLAGRPRVRRTSRRSVSRVRVATREYARRSYSVQ